jgi:hypothetical protein
LGVLEIKVGFLNIVLRAEGPFVPTKLNPVYLKKLFIFVFLDNNPL